MKKGVASSNSFELAVKLRTVLKRMMHTASFTIPSPNIIENSFGYSSKETIETAAITSVEQSSEHMSKISFIVRLNCSV